MNYYLKKITFLIIVACIFSPFRASAQFQLNGNATYISGDCYRLTDDSLWQGGSIWYTQKFDLNKSFDIEFSLHLGCKAYTIGADGLAFVFQTQSINAGSAGGGIGYGGITPSVAVEFDTYENVPFDPAFAHIIVAKNGDVYHTAANLLAGPVQMSPTNPTLPDCMSHSGRIIWDPKTQTLKVYFDCNLRLTYTGDIINTVFSGNPNVYWGFTASTGGASNIQGICLKHTFLDNLRDTTICKGNSVPLSVSGGATYSWTPASGLSSTTIPNPIATPITNTRYYVTITDSCGIQARDSIYITVPFTTLSTSTTNLKCFGDTDGIASVTTSGGTGTIDYLWSNGASSQTISNLSASSYSVTLSDGGCTTVTDVTITEPQVLNVQTTNVNLICIGQFVTLPLTVTGGTPAYVNNWQPSGPTVSPVTSTTYTVTVNDANNCVAAPQTIRVDVNLPLNVTAVPVQPICPGQSAILSATASGGNSFYTYTWFPGGVTTQTISVSPGVTQSYTVIVSDGCNTPPDQDTVSVVVNPVPQASFISDITSGCTPICVNFQDNSTITGGTIIGWQWNLGDTLSTQKNPIYCYKTAGIYTVSLTATSDKGCTGSVSQANMITVYPDPVADFSVTPQKGTILFPSIDFTDQSTGAVTWLWDFDDLANMQNSTVKNPTHTYSDTGTYTVKLIITNTNNCVDTILKTVTIENDFAFYIPNAFSPNDDGENDIFVGKGIGIAKYMMMIFDRWGSLLFQTTDINTGWDGGIYKHGGTISQQDIYVYVCVIEDIYSKSHKYRGHVTLVK